MSIRFETIKGQLEITATLDPDEIMLGIRPRGEATWVAISIGTKELVMAIKRIEEERDAHGEPTRRDSEEPRLHEHESRLRGAIYKAILELREVFRTTGVIDPHGEAYASIERAIEASKSIDEVEYIIRRVKEEYLRPDRPETWRESVDDLATKAAREEWYREIKGLD